MAWRMACAVGRRPATAAAALLPLALQLHLSSLELELSLQSKLLQAVLREVEVAFTAPHVRTRRLHEREQRPCRWEVGGEADYPGLERDGMSAAVGVGDLHPHAFLQTSHVIGEARLADALAIGSLRTPLRTQAASYLLNAFELVSSSS